MKSAQELADDAGDVYRFYKCSKVADESLENEAETFVEVWDTETHKDVYLLESPEAFPFLVNRYTDAGNPPLACTICLDVYPRDVPIAEQALGLITVLEVPVVQSMLVTIAVRNDGEMGMTAWYYEILDDGAIQFEKGYTNQHK